MKRIEQLDDNGCGMACVAMIAGLSYEEACLRVRKRESSTYTDTKDLRHALEIFGIKTSERLIKFEGGDVILHQKDIVAKSFKCIEDLKHDAILKVRPISRKKTDNAYHWVVWDDDGKRLFDPRKTPYKNLRVSSFLKIEC